VYEEHCENTIISAVIWLSLHSQIT